MIRLLKIIKQSCPKIWNLMEFCNGVLIKIFYGKRINKAIKDALDIGIDSPYKFCKLELSDAEQLIHLISKQPVGFDEYFKPHPFDLKTFRRILMNGTYVLIGAFDNGTLIGYSFIRLFINKSAYRGKMVDYKYQGQGIAKHLGSIMTKVAAEIGFRVFATISKYNVASIQSAKSGATLKVIKEMPDNYLYVEIINNK